MRNDLAGSVAPTRVWLLLGHKSGDNNQVLALAERLGWGFEEKRIAYRPWELLASRILGVTLA
ncbi:MAG: nucleoside-diphosphate sugar epimerase, partial [Gammaproteobacteria bacterium]